MRRFNLLSRLSIPILVLFLLTGCGSAGTNNGRDSANRPTPIETATGPAATETAAAPATSSTVTLTVTGMT